MLKKTAPDHAQIAASIEPGSAVEMNPCVPIKTFYETCQAGIEFFSYGLAHSLSGDIGQVNVFIVRFMVSPHHKDNLEPLCAQSP